MPNATLAIPPRPAPPAPGIGDAIGRRRGLARVGVENRKAPVDLRRQAEPIAQVKVGLGRNPRLIDGKIVAAGGRKLVSAHRILGTDATRAPVEKKRSPEPEREVEGGVTEDVVAHRDPECRLEVGGRAGRRGPRLDVRIATPERKKDPEVALCEEAGAGWESAPPPSRRPGRPGLAPPSRPARAQAPPHRSAGRTARM